MKADPTIIPSQKSTAADWVNWHKVLKASFGKKVANDLFLQAWNRRGGRSSDANTNELRSYLGNNGIVIDKTLFASITDTAYNVGDRIANTMRIGRYAVIGVGVVILIPVVMLLFNVARNPIGAAGAAAKFTPAGAAGGMR